jgi:hypothetical protein
MIDTRMLGKPSISDGNEIAHIDSYCREESKAQ